MSPGKAASQAGHAFKLLTKNLILNNPNLSNKYFDDGLGTNICLIAKNQNQLENAYLEALKSNLPTFKVIDSGHIMPPFFTGEDILTAIGIGPCYRNDIHHITKKFSIYR